jgi:hypothetical protein
MMRNLALSLLVLGVVATTAAAQPPGTAPGNYDPNAEFSYGGIVDSVIAVAGPDGTVGVHLNLKTGAGTIVKVHLGPAIFIGMNNFFFLSDDQILVKGAYVIHDGDVALWARQVSKGGKTLTLRSPDGAPRWPFATADDPDGCGVSHLPVRY